MTTWHADDDLLGRYADGTVDDVVASSIEAHLLSCPRCREQLGPHVSGDRLAAGWSALVAAVDAPRPGILERLLVWLGIRPPTARLLTATSAVRASWLAAVAVAVAFAVVSAARPAAAGLLFLALAPLVPAAGVAAAFGRSLDPMADLTDATPLAGLPLLLVRTVAATVPSVAVVLAVSLLLPGIEGSALWLLPALALSALSLLLRPLLPIEIATCALAVAWVAVVVLTEAAARGGLRGLRSGGAAESVLFQAPGQLVAAVVAIVAVLAVASSGGRTNEIGSYR